MKKILVTGGSGFVGSHIVPILKEKYEVITPTRQEMNLKDRKSVVQYFKGKKFDTVVHLASPTPLRSSAFDSFDTLFKDCITIFTNLLSVSSHFDKLVYSGSGAEYDKSRSIVNVSEEQIGERIPSDDYGLAKYVLNQLTRESRACYNLRIFGCYGPREYEYKFIRHVIMCVKNNEPITIKQDCYFDYMYVDDYAKFVEFIIDGTPLYHDYNACSGTRIKLSEIAMLIKDMAKSNLPILIEKEGMNLEYTGSNARFMSETKGTVFLTSLNDGIKMMMKEEGVPV